MKLYSSNNNINFKKLYNQAKEYILIKNYDLNNKKNIKKFNKTKKNKFLNSVNAYMLKNLKEVMSDFETDTSDSEDTDTETSYSKSMSNEIEEKLSTESILEEDYIKKCNIVITDFGNIINEGEIYDEDGNIEEIQTRYYRAPEVIMKTEYNKKIDMCQQDVYYMNY